MLTQIGSSDRSGYRPHRRLGKIMNHNFADYHVPARADTEDIEVIFVEEQDEKTSPLGVRDLARSGSRVRQQRSAAPSFMPPQTCLRYSDHH
jgi:hypothetical protein